MENKETIACPHCLKEFTKRGMPKHLHACKAKNNAVDLPAPAEDEQPPCLPIVVANEPVVDEVLQLQIINKNE
jgi:uncharacterized protein (DUF983 family)